MLGGSRRRSGRSCGRRRCGSACRGGGGEEGLCDLCGLFTVWREQFEAVGVEVVGVAGAVLATVGAVRMHEVPRELGGLDKGFQKGVIGLLRGCPSSA